MDDIGVLEDVDGPGVGSASPTRDDDGAAAGGGRGGGATSMARRRQRLEAVRGREVRALEDRVGSLEAERERLADGLRAATRVATEAIDAAGQYSGRIQRILAT